jgi:hypothetical protein
LRCHNLAQRWMKLDDFNHELPSASDAGLHVWVEAIGDDGDVDVVPSAAQLLVH